MAERTTGAAAANAAERDPTQLTLSLPLGRPVRGANALVARDDGSTLVPSTDADWQDWVAAGATARWCRNDALVDWLDRYGAACGHVRDDRRAAYDPRFDFHAFLAEQGLRFEEAVIADLERRVGVTRIATDPAGARSLAAAEATVSVQQQLLRAARADRWPTLSLATTYTEQAFPSNVFPAADQFRRGWNGELKLSFPIFLGFKTAGTIERARAALLTAQARRDQAREQVELEVAQARAELERARALLVARRATVRQAKRAHYLAGVRYANGMATQLEVSDARVLTQQAEVNQVQATRDYLLALAQLERALGRPVPVVRRSVEQVATGPNSGETQP